MTTPLSERGLGHLADLLHEIRPDWDVAGCVAALRKLPTIPGDQLVIAAARYAADQANITPAYLADLGNRAWDTDWYPPCDVHPHTRARHISGECAACRADRLAVTEPQPLRRNGGPCPDDLRAAMLAEIARPHPIATAERPKPKEPDVMAAARAELAAARRELDRAAFTTPSEATTGSKT